MKRSKRSIWPITLASNIRGIGYPIRSEVNCPCWHRVDALKHSSESDAPFTAEVLYHADLMREAQRDSWDNTHVKGGYNFIRPRFYGICWYSWSMFFFRDSLDDPEPVK